MSVALHLNWCRETLYDSVWCLALSQKSFCRIDPILNILHPVHAVPFLVEPNSINVSIWTRGVCQNEGMWWLALFQRASLNF